jgi:hypothetical protein
MKGEMTMTREQRTSRIASLRHTLAGLRAEAKHGFTDSTWEGRVLATAKERKDACDRCIVDCHTQLRRLTGDL